MDARLELRDDAVEAVARRQAPDLDDDTAFRGRGRLTLRTRGSYGALRPRRTGRPRLPGLPLRTIGTLAGDEEERERDDEQTSVSHVHSRCTRRAPARRRHAGEMLPSRRSNAGRAARIAAADPVILKK